jgi:hypothetical protein
MFILVGGIPTPLENMNVSWDDCSQYMESHKIPWFQSPPTSHLVNHHQPSLTTINHH